MRQISLYAHPQDLLNKTPAELQAIFDSGVTLLYVGLESGNDEVLRRIKKHSTAEKSIRACRRALEAGFRLSCTVIIGLGGKELTREHAEDTGRMITAISPHYLGCLTLMPYPGSELDRSIAQGTFAPLSTLEVMEEFRILLENIGPFGTPLRLPGQSRLQLPLPGRRFAGRPGPADPGSQGGAIPAGVAPARSVSRPVMVVGQASAGLMPFLQVG